MKATRSLDKEELVIKCNFIKVKTGKENLKCCRPSSKEAPEVILSHHIFGGEVIYRNLLARFDIKYDVITVRPHAGRQAGQSRTRAVGCRVTCQMRAAHSLSNSSHTGCLSARRTRHSGLEHRQTCRTAGKKVLLRLFSFIFASSQRNVTERASMLG